MLLSAYPSKHFTVVLLQTLTKLAIATCAQIPDQVGPQICAPCFAAFELCVPDTD